MEAIIFEIASLIRRSFSVMLAACKVASSNDAQHELDLNGSVLRMRWCWTAAEKVCMEESVERFKKRALSVSFAKIRRNTTAQNPAAMSKVLGRQ